MELRNTLNSKFGVDLPPTVTLDYPTISALAGYLAANATSALAAGAADEAAGNAASVTESDYSWSDYSYSDSLGSSLALAELPPAPLVAVAAVSGTLPGSDCITSVAEDAPSGALCSQSLPSQHPWLGHRGNGAILMALIDWQHPAWHNLLARRLNAHSLPFPAPPLPVHLACSCAPRVVGRGWLCQGVTQRPGGSLWLLHLWSPAV